MSFPHPVCFDSSLCIGRVERLSEPCALTAFGHFSCTRCMIGLTRKVTNSKFNGSSRMICKCISALQGHNDSQTSTLTKEQAVRRSLRQNLTRKFTGASWKRRTKRPGRNSATFLFFQVFASEGRQLCEEDRAKHLGQARLPRGFAREPTRGIWS